MAEVKMLEIKMPEVKVLEIKMSCKMAEVKKSE